MFYNHFRVFNIGVIFIATEWLSRVDLNIFFLPLPHLSLSMELRTKICNFFHLELFPPVLIDVRLFISIVDLIERAVQKTLKFSILHFRLHTLVHQHGRKAEYFWNLKTFFVNFFDLGWNLFFLSATDLVLNENVNLLFLWRISRPHSSEIFERTLFPFNFRLNLLGQTCKFSVVQHFLVFKVVCNHRNEFFQTASCVK